MLSCILSLSLRILIVNITCSYNFWRFHGYMVNLRGGMNCVVDLDLHVSFTSRNETYERSELVTFPKTLKNKSLREMVKKRCRFVANLTEGPSHRNRRQDSLMKQKGSDLTNCFPWWIFELRLTHTFSVSSRDDLSREFKNPFFHGTRQGSSILPFIGWRHDRIDTRLNEVLKLGISLEAENPRFVFTLVT